MIARCASLFSRIVYVECVLYKLVGALEADGIMQVSKSAFAIVAWHMIFIRWEMVYFVKED
jgi:hypothetical protein